MEAPSTASYSSFTGRQSFSKGSWALRGVHLSITFRSGKDYCFMMQLMRMDL